MSRQNPVYLAGRGNYLTAEGVDDTLAFIAHHSGPGSAVIFDYFYNEILQGHETKSSGAYAGWAENLPLESMKAQAEQFLTRRGFSDIRHADARRVKNAILPARTPGARSAKASISLRHGWIDNQ